jgi:hypothetical protein
LPAIVILSRVVAWSTPLRDGEAWWARQDSNLQPDGYEPHAAVHPDLPEALAPGKKSWFPKVISVL